MRRERFILALVFLAITFGILVNLPDAVDATGRVLLLWE